MKDIHYANKKDIFFPKGHLLDVQKSKKRPKVGKSMKSEKAYFTRVYKDKEKYKMEENKFPTMKSLPNEKG